MWEQRLVRFGSRGGFLGAARQAMTKLGVIWEPSQAQRDQNEGCSTRIPLNPVVRVKRSSGRGGLVRSQGARGDRRRRRGAVSSGVQILWGGQSCPQPPFRRRDPVETVSAGCIARPTGQRIIVILHDALH